MTDSRFESRVLAFERAWQAEGTSALTALLDRLPAPSGVDRSKLLIELIAIDMEFRARSGRSPGLSTLDDYAARFPELGTAGDWPVELVGEEYRVRQRWGDRPAHGQFLARFPARCDQIRAALSRIDAELAEERADGCEPARPAVTGVALPSIAHHDLRLERMIGAGRMGKVYRAWWYGQERAVAVKFLRKTPLREPRAVARFLAEASAIARLDHPHIVAVHGIGRTPAGAFFLVLDLVNRPNLDLVLRAGPLAIHDAVRHAIGLCDALEHAHDQGIIHCDLKPANILCDERGSIRVADFGLSRAVTEDSPWTAQIEGTASFMAPEQACRTWGRIDQRTDVFGIGAVLYALLTACAPWPGQTLPAILSAVVSEAPVADVERRRPNVPYGVADVCRRCLAKRPADRFATVREVRTALVRTQASLCGKRTRC